MTGKVSASEKVVLATLVGVFILALHAGPATAAGSLDNIFRKPGAAGRLNAPAVARFVSEAGDTFILDRTAARPLLKFDDGPEVYALTPQLGPRGDVIYKNELGDPVLRATHLGGVTLFTPETPNGQAASLMGPGAAIRLPAMSVQALSERLLQAAFRTSRITGRGGKGVVFQAEARPASTALMGDAATMATLALVRLADRPGGRARVARVEKVELVEGRKPDAAVKGSTLWISVAPDQGIAGRPSSERIIRVLSRGR